MRELRKSQGSQVIPNCVTVQPVSVIACPVDYSENTKLTEKLEHLGQPSELSCRVDE